MFISQGFARFHKQYLLLLVVFLVSLGIRLWLLDKRWINPDEGAHMMDSLLVLEGQVPLVDFGSRQPLYTYIMAGFFKLFGVQYIAGRLQAVTFSLLTGLVLFFLARALFDTKVALLSSTMHWMLPLEVSQSVIVKTEPLVLFLTCVSFYGVIRFSQHLQQVWWLILAGMCAALGFYVRQSALIIPVVVLGFLLLLHRGSLRAVAKHFACFLAGYLGIVLLALAYYSNFIPLNDLLTSGINPFRFVVRYIEELFLVAPAPALTSSTAPVSTATVTFAQNVSASWNRYYRYFYEAFAFHSFLFIGFGFSIVHVVRSLVFPTKRERDKKPLLPYALLYLWIFVLMIAYSLQFYTHAFFIDYFREFLPPLILIFSAWLCSTTLALQKEGNLERVIVAGLGVSILWFVVQPYYAWLFGNGYYASLVVAIFTFLSFVGSFTSSTRRLAFALIFLVLIVLIAVSREISLLQPYFSGPGPSLGMIGIVYLLTWLFFEKAARPSWKNYAQFVALSVIVASYVIGLSISSLKLNLTYDSAWSPQAVEEASAQLKTLTREQDEVMSGAVIWEFSARRKPFQMISHPLALRDGGVAEKERNTLKLAVEQHPPQVIIVDGYTEKTYMHQLPWLRELLQAKYQLITTVGPAKYPVEIYQLQ